MSGNELDDLDGSFVHDERLGISLDLSGMGLSADDRREHRSALESAQAEMRELERGAIANADEGRQVGHYWLRTPELAPTREIRRAIETTVRDVTDFALRVRSGAVSGADGPFRRVLALGIGGSALGPQLVADALAPTHPPLELDFLDNTDPDGMDRVLDRVGAELDRSLILVISKSGGTAETANALAEVESRLCARGLRLCDRAVAITGEGSKLDRRAVSEGWLARFPMWDFVGGRTSELSAVGLLPAALQGIDVTAMLEGARQMDRWTREAPVLENPATLLALAWFLASGGDGRNALVILPYKDRLALLARYLQQLVMESLGKEFDRHGRRVEQGLTVFGNKGSTDQHAYVQQLRDGTPNFFAGFVEVRRCRRGVSPFVEPGRTSGDYLHGFLHGTRRALAEKGRRSFTLSILEVTPLSMGAIVALFERTVGLYASLIDVNAYHQPGVEAGKRAATDILVAMAVVRGALASLGEATALDVVRAVPGIDAVTVFHLLRHIAANDGGIAVRPASAPSGWTFSLTSRWRSEDQGASSPRPR